MVPFDLELHMAGEQVVLTVEQLERFADTDGFSRYDIRTGDRRSVVRIHVTSEQANGAPPDEKDDPATKICPQQLPAFDEQGVFTIDELFLIAAAVLQRNREEKVVFAQFLLDF